MSRYIDADAVLELITEEFHKTDPVGAEQIGILTCRRIVRTAPTADVVEVVRCKDCIYNSNGSCTHSEIYDDTNYKPYYYCADGERRENETDIHT